MGTSKIGDLSEDDGIEWAVTGPSHDEGRDFRGFSHPLIEVFSLRERRLAVSSSEYRHTAAARRSS